MALSYENVTFLPIYIGVEKGLFTKAGVDLNFVYVLGGNKFKNVKLALKGDVSFIDGVSTAVEATVRQWGRVKVLCSGVRVPFYLMVRPGINTAADLKGKRVVAGSGGRSLNELIFICKQNGLEPDRDVTILKATSADRIEAFKDPGIDAVATRPQFWNWAEQNGFQRLEYEGGRCWYSGGIATTERMLAEQPETLRKVVKVYMQAIDFIKANREEAIRVILKNVRYLDDEGAAGNYDALHALWNLGLEPPGVEHMADVCRVAKNATLRPEFEDMVDLSFLNL